MIDATTFQKMAPFVLPNAEELRKMTDEVNENKRKQFIEDLKRKAVEEAKAGGSSLFVGGFNGDIEEIKSIFEPLGYEIEEIYSHWLGEENIIVRW